MAAGRRIRIRPHALWVEGCVIYRNPWMSGTHGMIAPSGVLKHKSNFSVHTQVTAPDS